MKKANMIAAVLGIVISIYALAVTFTFKQFKNVPVGPEFFPRLLAVGLLVCSIILMIQSIYSTSTKKAPTLSLKNRDMRRLVIAVLAVILYVVVWESVGFILATPVMMFVIMWLLNMKNYKYMILMSIVTSIGIFFAFKLLLGIEMPLGIMSSIF